MADHKDPMSSDDLLRQAWVDLKRDPDTSMSVTAAPVELGDVDIPDMDEVTERTASGSPVDSFVRTKRPAPPPPSTQRPPPPAPPRRSEPPPPTVPDKKSSKSRGRWVLAGIAVFALLRIFNSFDGSDNATPEGGSDAPTAVSTPALDFEGFDSSSGVSLVGTAQVSNSAVSLTRKEPGNTGGAVWTSNRAGALWSQIVSPSGEVSRRCSCSRSIMCPGTPSEMGLRS